MHWGSASHGNKGSEHLVNNEQFTMELHLVHYNGKFADGGAALTSDERDALAGVANTVSLVGC
jgi:carbonic anhydrase